MKFISQNRRSWYLGLIFIFVLIPLLISVILWLGFKTSFIANTVSLKASELAGQYVRVAKVVPHGFGGISLLDVRVEALGKDRPIVSAENITWNKHGKNKLYVSNGELYLEPGTDTALIKILKRLKKSKNSGTAKNKFTEIILKNCQLILPNLQDKSKNLTLVINDLSLKFNQSKFSVLNIGSAFLRSKFISAKLNIAYNIKTGATGTIADVVLNGLKLPVIEMLPLKKGGAKVIWADILNAEIFPKFDTNDICDGIKLQHLDVNVKALTAYKPNINKLVKKVLGLSNPHILGGFVYQFKEQMPLKCDVKLVGSNQNSFQLNVSMDKQKQLTIISKSNQDVAVLKGKLVFPKNCSTIITTKIINHKLIGHIKKSKFTVDVPHIGLKVQDIRLEDTFKFKISSAVDKENNYE